MDALWFNDLIRNLKHSPEKMEEFYKAFYLKLKAHIIYKFGRSEDVDDFVQDIFIKLVETEIKSFIKYPMRWLYTVTDNHIIDKFRVQRRVERLDENSSFDIDRTIMNADVKSHIEKLDIRAQRVLYMRYWEGYNFTEISKELNISYATVRGIVSKAMRQMKDAVILT